MPKMTYRTRLLWCWKIYRISLATIFLTISERSRNFQFPDGTSVLGDRKLFDEDVRCLSYDYDYYYLVYSMNCSRLHHTFLHNLLYGCDLWLVNLIISWPTFALLSPALCLEWVNGWELTAGSLSVVSYAPVHSVRQIGLAGAATATAERAQLIGRWSRHENCDTQAVDGRARLYSLQKMRYNSSYIPRTLRTSAKLMSVIVYCTLSSQTNVRTCHSRQNNHRLRLQWWNK